MPTFSAFYRAINGRDPFPWQARLAGEVAEGGAWPAEIGVPTGLGKTACLDIAVWWLALQADRAPSERTAPTRIWWLVNRRLLVDSTAEHAKKLQAALDDPASLGITGSASEAVRSIADRLRSLAAASDAPPLEVFRLRGGVESRRPSDPSCPAIILSTIPMYGSRFLFRGYGSSRLMRSIDAALAGSDSLLLVDEAHLARHLTKLIGAAADCFPDAAPVLPEERSRPQVVALTATGDAHGAARFELDSDDELNHLVGQRLDAAKLVDIRVRSGDPATHLADAVWDLLGQTAASSCLVFANTPATARRTFSRLQKRFRKKAELLLLTGQTREREAQQVRSRILDSEKGMAAGRALEAKRERHLIVVATQTLEVGADLDATHLVTEACGVRALTQRLGRLNRLGRYEHARAAYVHVPPRKARSARIADGWPVYGQEPEEVLARLKRAEENAAPEPLSLSPRLVSAALGEPGDDPGRAPEILNGLLWEWVKTTTPPDGEAPVEPFFSGIAGPDRRVTLVWRAHIPEDGGRLWPRPSDREAVGVPIGEAREALGDETSLRRLGPNQLRVEEIGGQDMRPGDVILLPSTQGHLDNFGWNREATGPVVDASIATHGLPLDKDALRRIMGSEFLRHHIETSFGSTTAAQLLANAVGDVPDEEDLDEAERRESIDSLLEAISDTTPKGWDDDEWREAVGALKADVVRAPGEVPRFRRDGEDRASWQSDDLDERSLALAATDLELHGRAVGARSKLIAEQIGILPELVAAIEVAGNWHDLGKVDRRFQRWLDPDNQNVAPVAKSNLPRHRWEAARLSAGWPRGGRHEVLSARMAAQRLAERHNGSTPHADLVLHLIISHHGHGRPLVLPVLDEASDDLSVPVGSDVHRVSDDLSIIDWDQPARFRQLHQRYGPWSLALLEAVVRMSDHTVSAGAHVHELETGDG